MFRDAIPDGASGLHDVDLSPGCAPCSPWALSALGAVLCLHREIDHNVLSGWSRARCVRTSICVDRDGPREALLFLDAAARVCWQLHRLPDSDYLAWETIVATLDDHSSDERMGTGRGDFLANIQLAIGRPLWQASVLKLHVVPGMGSAQALAAADVALSEAGRHAALLVSRHVGARMAAYCRAP